MRPTAVLLTSALLLVISTTEGTGADDPRSAIDTYLAAMNNNDQATLANVLNEFQRDEVKSHLNGWSGKTLTVESVHITQDFGPMFAFAHVQGTYTDRSRYDERIVVSKKEDARWYVAVPGPVRVPPGGKQPSSVTR